MLQLFMMMKQLQKMVSQALSFSLLVILVAGFFVNKVSIVSRIRRNGLKEGRIFITLMGVQKGCGPLMQIPFTQAGKLDLKQESH